MELMQTSIEMQSFTIIESENGFLVSGDFGGNAVEVHRTDTRFQCQCFIAQVSDSECEHVRAVQDYLSLHPPQEERPMLSQADADLYLGKLAKLDTIEGRNLESANSQIDRIKLWLEMETEKITRQKDFYIQALDNFMHMNEYSTKRLVNGTLSIRSQQPEILIKDEDTVLRDDRFVRIIPEKHTVDKAALRKYCTQTGEEIPGTEIILKPHKFSYKLNRGAE